MTVAVLIFAVSASMSLAEQTSSQIESLQENTLSEVHRIFGSAELKLDNKFITLGHGDKYLTLDHVIETENARIVRLTIFIKFPYKMIRLAGFVDGNADPLVFVHEFGPSASTAAGAFQLIQVVASFHSKGEKCGPPKKRLVFVGETVNGLIYFVMKPVRILTSSSECS